MTYKRHQGTLWRPGTTLDSLGNRDLSSDTVIASEVPYSYQPLAGRELEVIRANFPTATGRVRLFVDPDWQLVPRDYLVGDAGDTLEIVERSYAEGVEFEAELLVGQAQE